MTGYGEKISRLENTEVLVQIKTLNHRFLQVNITCSEDILWKWKEQIETNFKIALEIQKRLAGYSDDDWERKISMLKALDFERLVVFLNKLKGEF